MFSPALTDGSLGDMIYFHSYKNPGLIKDIVEGLYIYMFFNFLLPFMPAFLSPRSVVELFSVRLGLRSETKKKVNLSRMLWRHQNIPGSLYSGIHRKAM